VTRGAAWRRVLLSCLLGLSLSGCYQLTRSVAFVQREKDLGWGFGLTPPVITRDLLGVGGTHTLRQNRWGMRLLRHLQYALNANQDLDAGIHGFEQNDTPTSVGQRTLEWIDRVEVDDGIGKRTD
jgi:hypothetical protein